MQVNTTKNILGSYINFMGNEDTEYTLTLNKANLAGTYSDLYLIDLVGNKIIPMEQDVISYNFTALNNGTAVKRFQIVGKTNGGSK